MNFARYDTLCQVLLQNFLHFFCENGCNCQRCFLSVFLSSLYSIARFFININVLRIFFNLTAKMLRAQRNFDGVLMTYYFIFLGVHLGGFFESTPPICKKADSYRAFISSTESPVTFEIKSMPRFSYFISFAVSSFV